MKLNPIVQQLLQGALAGAGGNALDMLNQVRAGSMKLLVVFQTPDGKLEHIRILMDQEEAAKACKTIHRRIREEQKREGGGG